MQHDHLENFNALLMSEEEQKIREELETEIERDLEEEIKDGIRQLSLRLHRLYQHKKRRTYPSSSTSGISLQSESNDATVTKVDITITGKEECKLAAYESNSNSSRTARMSDSRPSSFMTTIRRRQVLNLVLKKQQHTSAHNRSRHIRKEGKNRNSTSSAHGRVRLWKY